MPEPKWTMRMPLWPTMNQRTRQTLPATSSSASSQSLHFPGLFDNDFGPSALLFATPTLTNRMNYGEGFNPSGNNDQFSISCPTIELPLDDLLFSDDTSSDSASHSNWSSAIADAMASAINAGISAENSEASDNSSNQDMVMASSSGQSAAASSSAAPAIAILNSRTFSVASSSSSSASVTSSTHAGNEDSGSTLISDDEDIDQLSLAPSTAKKTSIFKNIPPLSQAVKDILPETVAPSRHPNWPPNSDSSDTNRRNLFLSLNPAVLRGTVGSGLGNSAPGRVKAECSNCGTTHTPLWRRGLNDELNCNACGFMIHFELITNDLAPRACAIRMVRAARKQRPARKLWTLWCYNCHTTATPLWRKDNKGKTVCNVGPGMTPIVLALARRSGALGATADNAKAPLFNPFWLAYPGPYHLDYLMQLYNMNTDALPFSMVESTEISPRSTKRRKMSTDSTSEPPSSAVSFSSYTSHSKRASMEFPFSTYNSNSTINSGPALCGSSNTFWHPPMMPQGNTDSGSGLMSSSSSSSSNASNAANEDSPMALQDEESLFLTYLHLPMALPEELSKGQCGPEEWREWRCQQHAFTDFLFFIAYLFNLAPSILASYSLSPARNRVTTITRKC
ncbi:hypothetical protein CPB84DRAFT_1755776 [Gymnopilus junonius]|uniref:GATA-type domain-containing protein n=1 Tax=Gymnopilus junonius TaxID=109634 RepID=A0A9P5N6R7_GYMJU|nr:hypothetical protein CPB84DRAFT_1755776 [Gymnopilus junonius]